MKPSLIVAPLLLLVSGLYGAEAQACSQNPPGLYVYSALSSVPFDGAWVGRVSCRDCESFPSSYPLVVTDGHGAVVAGAVEGALYTLDTTGYLAWTPAAPLVPGETYSVAIEGVIESSPVQHTFVAGPSLELVTPRVPIEMMTREAYDFAGPEICCVASRSGCPGDDGCDPVAESATRKVGVGFNWSDDEGLNGEQFLYKSIFTDGADVFESSWYPEEQAGQMFDDRGQEVCAQVIARRIATGEEHQLLSECVDLSDVPVTVSEEEAIRDQRESVLRWCEVPVDYEEEWCSIYAGPLSTGDCSEFPPVPCEAALLNCPQGTEPDVMDGEGVPDAETGAASEEDAEFEERPSPAGGCHLDRGAPASPYAFLAALGSLAVLRRRRPDADGPR